MSTTARHSINNRLYTPKFSKKKPMQQSSAASNGKNYSMLKKYLVKNNKSEEPSKNTAKFSDKGGTPMNYSISNVENASFEIKEGPEISQILNRSQFDSSKFVQTPRATITKRIQDTSSKRITKRNIKQAFTM